jgi:anti-sigma factor RsiW
MSTVRASLVCERARAQVSLDLDAELSVLERRMLASHLLRCDECRAYSDQVNGFTRTLREAPLEAPAHPVVVRRPRRRVHVARIQVGVAAVLAVATVGVATQVSDSTGGSSSAPRVESEQNLSPPSRVMEREQAILNVVRPGLPLPPSGSVL